MRTAEELDDVMKNLDFSQGKMVSQVPALAKLQAQRQDKIAKQLQNEKPVYAINDDV